MQPRPRREDIPYDDPEGAILHELRLLAWEFWRFRDEVNGDVSWLRVLRVRVSEAGRILLVGIPVLLAAILALHIAQP